jgi:acetyl-CoA carboxylase carboxyl transferase subunit beta
MANGWFGKRKAPPSGDVPEGLWQQCPRCKELLFAREWERDLKVCRKCNYHFRLSAHERVALLTDEDSFQEHDGGLTSTDPLQFPGYSESLERNRKKTGLTDACLSGEARIDGIPLMLAVTDAGFMMGSMGSVVGERMGRALDSAAERQWPGLVISASGGGARMHEGLLSLMQMAKTSGALAQHHREGLGCVLLLTDPTMGGVTASWGTLGDFVLAEPGAMIGFAGLRVSRQAQVSNVPKDFQTSEFQKAHGHIDRIVPRAELRETIVTLLEFTGAFRVEVPDRSAEADGEGA